MMFQIDLTEIFFRPMARFGGFFILILGVIWIVYGIYEGKRRGSYKERKVEDWDFKITRFLKVLTYLGFFVGIFAIMSGVAGLMLDEPPSVAYSTTVGVEANIFTGIILIIIGLFTFLKPLNDLPIASIIGLALSTLVVVFVALMIPDYAIEIIALLVDPKIFFIVLFLIMFAIVALTVKFYIGGLMSLSKIISWPPIAIILAIFCFIQGFLILVIGVSLI
ncbi:MAG: hypothetical protein GF317_14705 [Candidatus Lokiarchaeota archaeon]|jgi:hypothetical protein|nr:hypothetical protein [Candidatus Lokiarchaeota archaeon]MBD3200858.1 hypothetical protein [Candidatus Lokiarchaeota archaeon]